METIPVSTPNPFSPGQIKRRKLEEEKAQQKNSSQSLEKKDEEEKSSPTTNLAGTKVKAMIHPQTSTNLPKTLDTLYNDDDEDDEMMDENIIESETNYDEDSSKRFVQPDGRAQTLEDVMKSVTSSRVVRK